MITVITRQVNMPDFYGGFQNSFSYKGFELDFTLPVCKAGRFCGNYGYLSTLYGALKNKRCKRQRPVEKARRYSQCAQSYHHIRQRAL